MTKEELKQYLTENLKTRVYVQAQYSGTIKVEVELVLEGESIHIGYDSDTVSYDD